MNTNSKEIQEKELHPMSGYLALLIELILVAADVLSIIFGVRMINDGNYVAGGLLIAAFCLLLLIACIFLGGLKALQPNEALVLSLFGNYHGTIKKSGFYFVNPFCIGVNPAAKTSLSQISQPSTGQIAVRSGEATSKKISTKIMTLNNNKQKVNDSLGNPVEVGAVVIWKVVNPTKAVFNVNNYKSYLSIQCDSTIRNTARKYPYDIADEENLGDEKTLRGSSQEIADQMKIELQDRVKDAGLEVMEVRITHLAYAPEIAAAMLQRQQAVAVIAARQKIVEGAVGMVEMALDKLSENNVVELDDERKAAMVSNLLVVLCGNKDAQPIVNSGSLY
ncbi:SPFH domain-containing protein [Cuneatibacter sp. NSJ-177]|uniref:SPFH domain-containing protein n=1 Tax=Cuneatibacter sp. NSJ-177 TaxID=2931401 RepID=UPI001FD2387C|nr:SPFH domain-containing protein [Cuneatibacter sp. NSJ-177]MCJ7834396.1 SPFH domain-containing protein [Cuneatibacter sp. NSJ-177]